MRVRPRYIRARLTLGYLGIFTLVIFLYLALGCSVLYWQLSDQLYHAEIQDLETVEGLLYFTPGGQLRLDEDYHSRPESKLLLERLFEVLDTSGQVLYRNDRLKGQSLGGAIRKGEMTVGHVARRLTLSDGTHVLAVSHLHPIKGKPLLLRVAYSTDPLRLRIVEFLGVMTLVLPPVLVAAGFAGYRMAGKALDPLEAMTRLTEQITARRLNSRIPVENPDDELGHMARVLNQLLERLEDSFVRLRRFTADVSHELRTPLSSMRSVGEVGLETASSPGEYQDVIGSMLDEVARLTSTVDTLLTIAHADSGAGSLQPTVFPVMEIVEETVAVVCVLAEEKGQEIRIEQTSGAYVQADRAFLRMAIMNLIENAVKYSPEHSSIRIAVDSCGHAASEPRTVRLMIQDEGPGIPEPERLRIFDRFYRSTKEAHHRPPGSGLGLSIAQFAVESHGGQITVETSEGGGSTFLITLPAVQPPAGVVPSAVSRSRSVENAATV